MKRILFLLLLFPTLLFAKSDIATRFLFLPQGARPAGIGEAFCAIADDYNAILWNPAGISQIDKKEISFTHTKYLVYINTEQLAFIMPTKYGNLGTSIFYLSDQQIRMTENGEFDGEFENKIILINLSYSKKLNNKISIGTNFKHLGIYLADKESIGFGLDFGFLYNSFIKNTNIGANIQNIGYTSKFIDYKISLPLNLKIGIAHWFFDKRLAVLTDCNFSRDYSPNINFGTEIKIKKIITFRFGYKLDNELYKSSKYVGLSCGFGLSVNGCSLDYAILPFGELGNIHKLSIGLRF